MPVVSASMDADGGVPLTTELGTTGLRRFGGIIDEEFLPELRGLRGRATLREMADNDPVVGAGLLAIDLSVRQVSWTVVPADESPAAVEVADFCRSCLDDMATTWPETLSEALSMLVFGFSLLEDVFKYRRGDRVPDDAAPSKFTDGRLGWASLPIRGQEALVSWDYDEASGRLESITQLSLDSVGLRTVPMGRLLHFRTKASKDNPEGRPVLRNAYRSWWMKRRIEEIEAVGVERDLAGLPIAWVPPRLLSADASANEKILLERIRGTIRAVRRNESEGLVWPLDYDADGRKIYDLTLLSSGGARQFDTSKVIGRYDHRILLSMLADFLLFGAESSAGLSTGSAAEARTEFFQAAVTAWVDMIAAEFTDVGFRRLTLYNGWPSQLTPTLKPGPVAEMPWSEVVDSILKLAQAGAPLFPDPELLGHLLSRLDVPWSGAAAGGL